MAKRSFFIEESQLDEYQLNIHQRRIDVSFIVKGCAGSGKSILALWNVKQIQEENKGSFYFIVFTKALRQYMEDGIRAIGLDNSRVLHFKEWERQGYPSSDYLIVDEAQDFDEREINIFLTQANKIFRMYGDTAQQLYAFKNANPLTMEDIASKTKKTIEQLVFNHRLPKKIARLVDYLESTGDNIISRCRVEGTEFPKVLRYNNLDEQLESVMNIIQTRGYDDVGIFFTYNEQVQYAYNYFHARNFQVEVKYNDSMDLNFHNSLPKLTTYHSSKGLQFESVFIPNCEDKYIIYPNPYPHSMQEEVESKRNALYVALTRSYENLFIMYSENLTSFFNDIPNNLYETSLITEDIDW